VTARPSATAARRALVALCVLAALAAGCRSDDRDRVATQAPGTGPTVTTAAGSAAGASEPVISGFLAFGDFGGGDAQQGVAAAMDRWAASHRVDALVTTGDNVYEEGEPKRFGAQLDRPYQRLRRGRPLWVTLGNHDVAGGHEEDQLRHLGLPELPYVKELPGVQLLFLDGNEPDDDQAAWLADRLAEPGPPFRVVVFHQPAWSCSVHGSTDEIDELWVPVLEDHRVALVLNGHDHNYQRFVSDAGVTYVVTGGGGKGLYRVDADCPDGTPQRKAAAARHHFTAVEVRERSLTLSAVAADGQVLDRAVIRR
jgi:calcineurin-like phosphoesterase family protein